MKYKAYEYLNLSFKASDDTNITIEVELLSNVDKCYTTVFASTIKTKKIKDSGTRDLGRAKDLRSDTLRINTAIANPYSGEDTIKVCYKINGQEVLTHTNPKTEADEVLIIAKIAIVK